MRTLRLTTALAYALMLSGLLGCAPVGYDSPRAAAQAFATGLIVGDTASVERAFGQKTGDGRLAELRVTYFGVEDSVAGAEVLLGQSDDSASSATFLIESVQWPDGTSSQPRSSDPNGPPWIVVLKEGSSWVVVGDIGQR